MITALVAVIGAVVPPLIHAFHTPQSDIELQTPFLDGTVIQVLAVNRGDAAGALMKVEIRGDYLAPATKVRLQKFEDAIIPPGAKVLTLEIIPLLDEKQSHAASLEAMSAVVSKQPLPASAVVFAVSQSDGQVDAFRHEISDGEMFQLLRGNADRCASLAEPDFMNGCIGNGTPEE